MGKQASMNAYPLVVAQTSPAPDSGTRQDVLPGLGAMPGDGKANPASRPPAQEPATEEEAYVDALIDPTDLSEDDYAEYYLPQDDGIPVYNDIGYHARWEQGEERGEGQGFPADPVARFRHGVSWSARGGTGNFGLFSLDATAYQREDEPLFYADDEEIEEAGNWELGSFRLGQFQFPLTSEVSLDSILGVHEPAFRVGSGRHNYSRSLISRRFGTNNARVLGLSTRLYRKHFSLGLSAGRLGQAKGGNPIVSTFEHGDDDGDLLRMQATQAFDRHLLTGGLWQTDGFAQTSENLTGGRVTLDSIFRKNWKSSLTLANNAGNAAPDINSSTALLAGFEQVRRNFDQDFGVYFYQPDFYWLNTRLGDDNLGGYYRFRQRASRWQYGGSIELRQDGVEDFDQRRDTVFVSVHLGQRLSRRSSLFARYSQRNETTPASSLLQGSQSHQFSAGYNWLHHGIGSSHFGFGLGQRDRDFIDNESTAGDTGHERTQSLSYLFRRANNDDSELDLSLDYLREDKNEGVYDSYNADVRWAKNFLEDKRLWLGVGYRLAQQGDNSNQHVDSREDQGWHGQAGLDWLISDRWDLSASIGYNVETTSFGQRNDLSGDLVTDPDAGALEQTRLDDWQAMLELHYRFGNIDNAGIIAQRRGKLGSGTLKGMVFADHNGDGVQQANEPGLAGVDVFLDSIYPLKTDQNGEFHYRRVGTGKHWVYVDETSLPLPWSLGDKEFFELEIKLRGTSKLAIPVNDI